MTDQTDALEIIEDAMRTLQEIACCEHLNSGHRIHAVRNSERLAELQKRFVEKDKENKIKTEDTNHAA